jgi:homoserine kinase type II
MEHLDIPAILARFGHRPIGEPEPLAGGEDNHNLRVATDQGHVVVREYLRSELAKIRAELKLVEFLSRSGFPTPAPLIADSGEPVLDLGRPVAVFPFVSGEVPPLMTPGLAEQCGSLLARMHVLTADWADERIPVIDRRGLIDLAIASDVDLEGADAWREELRAFRERNADALMLLDEQPAGPLHHDLHRQNLLVEDSEVTAVLDFDELNRGPLIIDVARMFHYLAVDEPDKRLPVELAEAAVAGYQRVRPLTATEVELLPLAFDLVGIVDAAGFIMWAAPHVGATHVDDCHSWLAYRRNRNALR